MGQPDLQPPPALSNPPAASLVLFTLDDMKLGLDTFSVQRAVRAVAVTPLPNAPAAVLGVVNVQGRVLPVFNMRRRLGLPERPVLPDDHLIIAQAGARTVCLLVDSVVDVSAHGAAVPSGEILPGLGGIEGAAKLEGGLVFIYNLEKFLSIEEAASLDAALA